MNRHNTLPFSFVSSLLSLNHLQPRASNLVPKSILRLVPLTFLTQVYTTSSFGSQNTSPSHATSSFVISSLT